MQRTRCNAVMQTQTHIEIHWSAEPVEADAVVLLLALLGCEGASHSGGLGFDATDRPEKDVRVVELHLGRDAASDPVLDALHAALGLVIAEQLCYQGRAAERLDALRVRLNEKVGCVHNPD